MVAEETVYWMRLNKEFMTSDIIDFIMIQPNGAQYVVLYQMLVFETLNTSGRLSRQIGEITIPFDVEKIKRDCKWFSEETIREAIELYKKIGLLCVDSDGSLYLANYNDIVGERTYKYNRDRNSKEYRDWRNAVFRRDGFKCSVCGETDDIQAHHIAHWSKCEEKRFDVDNGVTLCKKCHLEAHHGCWRY